MFSQKGVVTVEVHTQLINDLVSREPKGEIRNHPSIHELK